MSLHEHQRRFAAALLDPGLPIPDGLIGPDRAPSTRRFNVYRNNVVVGLIEALKAAFPAVCRIVGDAFFTAMARAYVALAPPATPIMLEYGATFPDFIEAFEPAMCVPYLADIARLECAWVEAYHAAEADPVDPALLASIDADSLPRICLRLHPSLRVVRSCYPVVRIWSMNMDGGIPTAIDVLEGGEDAIIIRPVADVTIRVAAAGAAGFILAVQAQASVSDATARAFHENPAFDLAGVLRGLFAIDAIVGWNVRAEVTAAAEAAPITIERHA
ncbi:MAG TPA: DNA-binding domain-containing protein [Paraburkholderia sp.]|nr:DNA-binding domain-containing protein [Paraburkholderia sp.]